MHDEVMVTHIDVAGNLRVRGVRGNSEQVATLYPSQLTHEEPPGRRRTPRRNSPEAMPDNVSDDEIFTYKLKRMGL